MLEVINTTTQFSELREEWSELLAHSSSDCIFLTWEWLFTWWEHLAGTRSLHILAVRNGAELVAIAPLASASTGLIRLTHVRALEFLGTGSVGSDYLDIIVRQGYEDSTADVLSAYLQREHFVLDLKQLSGTRSMAAQVASRLHQKGWSQSESQINVCPFIELSGHTWNSFHAGLGPKHRYNFQRRLKNLLAHFDTRFDCVVSEDRRGPALTTLVDLHMRRRQTLGGSDGLHLPELVRFHDALTQLALEKKWLRLFLLTLNGEEAAALYGFNYGGRFYFYQSGFDPRFSSYSVGLVTMGLAIQAAINDGACEFDMLHGDETYKSLWARKHRNLVRIELHPPTKRAWMYAKAIALDRFARRAVRTSLTMLNAPAGNEAK